jgi:hypothetical protein
MQLLVGWQENRFIWRETQANDALRARVTALGLPEGYTSEIGFAAEGWVRSVADMLEQGVLLLVDYGFPRAEFYHPQRATGTLMCHYRHRAHTDPLVSAGLQDITAQDFSARQTVPNPDSTCSVMAHALFLQLCLVNSPHASIRPTRARICNSRTRSRNSLCRTRWANYSRSSPSDATSMRRWPAFDCKTGAGGSSGYSTLR